VTEEKKCSKCGRVMADDECGDEFPEERVCDKCAGITPEQEAAK
jgi:RNA polymerase subunit RPABC4/transcription elongation factor Spt4